MARARLCARVHPHRPLGGLLGVLASLTLWALFRRQIPASTPSPSHTSSAKGTYGRFRSWGSAGFIIGGLLLGWLVELIALDIIPIALALMLALTLVAVWCVPGEDVEARVSEGSLDALKRLLSKPELRALYVSAFLSRLTQHGLYGFLPHHLKDLGVDDWALPLYWSVGVLSEIFLFATRVDFPRPLHANPALLSPSPRRTVPHGHHHQPHASGA